MPDRESIRSKIIFKLKIRFKLAIDQNGCEFDFSALNDDSIRIALSSLSFDLRCQRVAVSKLSASPLRKFNRISNLPLCQPSHLIY